MSDEVDDDEEAAAETEQAAKAGGVAWVARGESALLLPLEQLKSPPPPSCESLKEVTEPERDEELLRRTPSTEMLGRRLEIDFEEPSAFEAELGSRGRIIDEVLLLSGLSLTLYCCCLACRLASWAGKTIASRLPRGA